MIDIHTHILPNLDDGSQSVEESLDMAVIAVESGVDTLVCTPHANQKRRFENYYSQRLVNHFEWFRRIVREERIPLHLLLGMEIFSTDDAGEMILDRKLISLNHSGYYLVEFPFQAPAEEITRQLKRIFMANGRPVVAHPERYFCVQSNPRLAYEWGQMGCLLQMNKGSVFGNFGRGAYEVSQTLLDYNLISCVATDAHSPEHRNTYMADIWAYLEQQFGEEMAYRLTTENPARILEGRGVRFRGLEP